MTATGEITATSATSASGEATVMGEMKSEQPLRVVIVGHVDHGKSTLIGRLFHETGSLPTGKLEAIQKSCEKRGVPFEWAFLMDALQAERDQNITIDASQIWFRTAKRRYVIIDAPGHREFLKNMITGAATADAAFLLIAANEGVREQSRRHAYMLSLLGIRQVVVLVNKMDLIGYSSEVFDAIETEYRAFLAKLGVEPIRFIPMSARDGHNLAVRSNETPWYQGPTIVESLDKFAASEPPVNLPLRFPIQDVYRFDHRRILAGRIEAGTLSVGDKLIFEPHGKVSTVASIETWNEPAKTTAKAGESVGITLTEQIFVERGHVARHEANAPLVTTRFRANVFWMGQRDLKVGQQYRLKLVTQEVDCKVAGVLRVVDAGTLEEDLSAGDTIRRHDVAEVVIETKLPVALDTSTASPTTGRFVIVDQYDVAGGGIVAGGDSDNRTHQTGPVSTAERAERNGHRGGVIWLTGKVGTGKRKLGKLIERELFNRGVQTFVLAEEDIAKAARTDATKNATDDLAHVAAYLALAGVVTFVVRDSDAVGESGRARAFAEGLGCLFTEIRFGAGATSDSTEGTLHVDIEKQSEEEISARVLEVLLPRFREGWSTQR